MIHILLALNILMLLILALVFYSQLKAQRPQQQFIRLTTLIESQNEQLTQLTQAFSEQLHRYETELFRLSNDIRDRFDQFRTTIQKQFLELQQNFNQQQINNLQVQQEQLQRGLSSLREQVHEILNSNTKNIAEQLNKLTHVTEQRLHDISNQVERRLSEGFEKTTATFTDIIKRLALIDEAQKKITELSSNVVSLQEILADKRSRGAFGEVQLEMLIRNLLPQEHFAFQYTMTGGKRADCVLFLPPPTGNIAIDAKFPLESYRRLTDSQLSELERKPVLQQFRQDIRKHIHDIAEKYIIPGETADGAVMFIPAEAVFAEIHAHHYDLVETAQRLHVWLVSPTTMMAILNTANAVIKDDATRKQIHIIQEHLHKLAKHFAQFRTRMEKLSQHIRQANQDVELIHISSKKITSQFDKIEKVELSQPLLTELESLE